jgi:hypothetical protein
VFMAHALCEHMACVQYAEGHLESGLAYRNCRQRLAAWYPLAEPWEARLLDCTSELGHLLSGTAPNFPLNGFHLEALSGNDPRNDPELLEVERRHVAAFFRRHANATAIELCVGPPAFERLKSGLLTLGHLGAEAMICEESWRALAHERRTPALGAGVDQYRHGDSNPGFRRERAAS